MARELVEGLGKDLKVTLALALATVPTITEIGMASLMPRAPEGAVDVLTPDQLQAIEGFRAQMLSIRSELSDVQFALRRNVDDLKNWVTALNVGVVPLVVAIIALLFAMRRPRRPVPVKEGRQS